MAYNENDRFSSNDNPLSGLIRTAVGLAPLAGAGYLLSGRIKANAAMNPAVPFGVGTGNIPAVGRAVGTNLSEGFKDSRSRDLTQLKKLTDEIMAADDIQRLFSATGEQQALVQSLLEAMDDPTSGLQNQLMGYREKLLNLATDSADPDKLKEVIQTVVRAIDGNASETAKTRWMRNLREYKRIGPQLVAPGIPSAPERTFTQVEVSSLNKAGRKRYNTLIKKLGKQGAERVTLLQRDFMGVPQYYAQVFKGRAGKTAYSATLPMQLTETDGVLPVFTGERLQTAYAGPKRFIDGSKALEYLEASSNPSYQELNKAAGSSLEDTYLRNYLNRLVNVGGETFVPHSKSYREWQRQHMELLPRIGYSSNNAAINQHLNIQVGHATNMLSVNNLDSMSEKERREVMLRIGSTVSGVGSHAPGHQFLIRGLGKEWIGRMGLEQGSPLEAIQSIGEPNRGYFPLESRIEQVWGRQNMFVQSKARTMGRGGVMHAGPTTISERGVAGSVLTHLDRNIDFASALTGATNRAVFIDTMGRINTSLGGTGAALSASRERVRTFSTKPILDPGEKGYMAGKLFMENIFEQAKDGQFVHLTQEQIKQHQNFLGFGPNSTQFLKDDPRTTDLWATYSVTEANGKRQINVMTMSERDMEVWKGFSTQHKGMIQSISQRRQFDLLGELGWSRSQLKAINVSPQDPIIMAGDMLKKGAGFFDLQMRGGYSMVAGDANFHQTLQDLAKVEQFAGMGGKLGRTTGAVIKALGERVTAGTTTAKEAGHVLAAIYTKGEDASYFPGVDKEQMVKRADLDNAINLAFGNKAGIVKRVASTGSAISATSLTSGMGPGDYALGRGSVEPRFIINLQHRLKNMGLNMDQISDIITGVYKNKIGGEAALKAASGMLRMMESVTGTAGLAEGISQLDQDLPTLTLKNLPELSGEGFEKFISEHKGGFIFDATADADTEATRAIASKAKDALGQGQIFIPGSEVTDAMRDTFIKSSGDFDLHVSSEYSQLMRNLFTSLSSASSHTEGVADTAEAAFNVFKEGAGNLSSRAIYNVNRGKIRGMQTMIAGIYDMEEGVVFSNKAHFQIAKDLVKRTHGMAAFQDKFGFLSQMNDWMGAGSSKEMIKDAARKAEMFFLGMDRAIKRGSGNRTPGVLQIATRHPQLSIGNITAIQVFREIREAATSDDSDIFDRMQGLENSQWKGVSNWGQVQNMKVGQRHAFFRDMVTNLGDIAPEGGGQLWIPRITAKANLKGGREVMFDAGIAAAAGGDWDGDAWMTMMLDRKAGDDLMSTMKGKAREAWQPADTMYKIKSEIYAQEAKEGLKSHAKADAYGFESVDRLRQSLLKEDAAKSTVGLLDTQLTKMRLSVMDMGTTSAKSREQADDAMALLKVIQEHAVIKGKKLPTYLPFAEALTGGIKLAFESGDLSEFDRVVREQIFPGSDLLTSGIEIESVDSPYAHARVDVQGKMVLRETLDFLRDSVQRATITGIADRATSGQLMALWSQGTPQEIQKTMALLHAGQTLESSMIHSATGPTTGKQLAAGAESLFHRIGSSVRAMDKGAMGVAVTGVLGSLAVMGLISHSGNSPSPMTMPGEILDPSVRSAINHGNPYQGPSVENFNRGGEGYANINRPNTIPTTYVQAPNSYQIRGQVPSMRGIGQVNDYLSSVSNGTSGSIRVNDTRQALTSSYVDKMLGMY